MRFSEARLPQVIGQARHNLGLNPDTYNEYDTQLGRQILQEASQSFMTTVRSLRTPNLREIQLQNLANMTPAPGKESDVAVKEEPQGIERQQLADDPINTDAWPADTNANPQPASKVHFHPPMPPRSISLPARSAAPTPNTAPATYSYEQHIDGPSYYDFVPSDFEHAPFLTGTDFEAVIEDPDLYAPSSLNQNDLEEFTLVDNPARHMGSRH